MQRPDLSDLRLFVHIAEARSITGGAARAHLSLAAASERLRAMEEALGARLLARERRGVRLLPPGSALLARARAVLAEMEGLRQDLAAHARGEKGIVRVLSNTAAMSEILPGVLARYLAENPAIDLDVEEASSEDIAIRLARGASDLGVLSDRADLSGLEAYPLRPDPLALLLPRNDVLAGRGGLRLAEAQRRAFVGLPPGTALQRYVERSALESGAPLRIRLRAQSLESLCGFVPRGIGLAVVPR